jgi:DNA-binding XRE family transcriptional regulator
LTLYVLKCIYWDAEETTMARTLDDYLERSKRASSPEVSAARAVFDQASSIARQVSELREKHQFTQTELAEKAGLPQAQISRIERGVISPTSATLAKIANALGADLRLVERPPVAAELLAKPR